MTSKTGFAAGTARYLRKVCGTGRTALQGTIHSTTFQVIFCRLAKGAVVIAMDPAPSFIRISTPSRELNAISHFGFSGHKEEWNLSMFTLNRAVAEKLRS